MTHEQINSILAAGLEDADLRGKRILAIIPDTTRTAPVGLIVKSIHRILREQGAQLDLLIALGTHQPLSRDAILRHLDLTEESYSGKYADMRFFNHRWDDRGSLTDLGSIPEETIERITEGLMAETVDITVNRMILDYDHLLIVGPVFPHEVAGFSAGSKYIFPGIAGPEIIDFFHWLGAVITNLKIIGVRDNPVREVLNEAARLVPVPVSAVHMVVDKGALAGLYVGPTEESWQAAVEQSAQLHIIRKPRTYRRVLSCAPGMYDDLWTGGKCMYKCEPIVEEGGELVIYAPHIDSLSYTHAHIIEQIGYHVRDYFLKQPERFADVPRAVMAVSTYVKGSGDFEDGIERPRINVTLATGISAEMCKEVGLGYLNPDDLDFDEWKGREDDGILLVEKAGETLYLPDEKE